MSDRFLLDKTIIHRLESFKALSTVCTENVFWTLNLDLGVLGLDLGVQ